MTISECRFSRAEARDFLEENAERRVEEKFEWGKGSDKVVDARREDGRAGGRRARRGQGLEGEGVRRRLRLDHRPRGVRRAGAARPSTSGPTGRSPAGYPIPNQGAFGIGLGMVAPTILAHAIPEVRERYLRPMYRGDIVGCQLFSEPVAGSDLAGIQTKAERDGDEWSRHRPEGLDVGRAPRDIGEIITRTSPDKPKHKGLTMFVVDMHAPGVEVRPLRQMTGGASFNEVFFDEVRVHDTHRLGDVDEGWTVALTTLMNERAAIGGGGAGVGTMSFTRFVELAHHLGVAEDPLIRQGLADVYIHTTSPRTRTCGRWPRSAPVSCPGPRCRSASSRSPRT